jgi:hypothetical protein
VAAALRDAVALDTPDLSGLQRRSDRGVWTDRNLGSEPFSGRKIDGRNIGGCSYRFSCDRRADMTGRSSAIILPWMILPRPWRTRRVPLGSIRSERRGDLAGGQAAVGVGGLLDGAGDGGALLPALKDRTALRVGSTRVTPVLLAVGLSGQLQGVDVDLVHFKYRITFQSTRLDAAKGGLAGMTSGFIDTLRIGQARPAAAVVCQQAGYPGLYFRVAWRGDVDGGFERREVVGRGVGYSDQDAVHGPAGLLFKTPGTPPGSKHLANKTVRHPLGRGSNWRSMRPSCRRIRQSARVKPALVMRSDTIT